MLLLLRSGNKLTCSCSMLLIANQSANRWTLVVSVVSLACSLSPSLLSLPEALLSFHRGWAKYLQFFRFMHGNKCSKMQVELEEGYCLPHWTQFHEGNNESVLRFWKLGMNTVAN